MEMVELLRKCGIEFVIKVKICMFVRLGFEFGIFVDKFCVLILIYIVKFIVDYI